ncbi:response regulator transcription factor [Streptomyces sp. BK022]|uniref:LuxR C-terminal-related transcriptional regulator n=1 Tax=Streptomyces sp. BK022 TaxID=2512123 RepID=UPI00102A2401|nr:response regulator transcription factor [Streptomyces sp. BK022]
MNEEPTVRRAVIAEDSVLLRMGLVKVVEMAGFEVAAEVGDGPGLLAAVAEHRPDLALVDVRMPPDFQDEGVRAALAIRRTHPSTALLLLSQYVEERYATDLLAANTSGVGYLLKQRVADVEEFVEALRRVANGGTALDPQVVAQLLIRRTDTPLARLTPREREVLSLMAEGRSNAGIATQLVISESAVAKHINNILMKLDLPRADADHRRVLAVLHFLGVGGRRSDDG